MRNSVRAIAACVRQNNYKGNHIFDFIGVFVNIETKSVLK